MFNILLHSFGGNMECSWNFPAILVLFQVVKRIVKFLVSISYLYGLYQGDSKSLVSFLGELIFERTNFREKNCKTLF